MKIIDFLIRFAVICLILLVIGFITLVIVDSKIPRPPRIPIEDREPNYIVDGERVYCFMMSSNVFGTGIKLDGCSNGKTYYNVQNVISLSTKEK